MRDEAIIFEMWLVWWTREENVLEGSLKMCVRPSSAFIARQLITNLVMLLRKHCTTVLSPKIDQSSIFRFPRSCSSYPWYREGHTSTQKCSMDGVRKSTLVDRTVDYSTDFYLAFVPYCTEKIDSLYPSHE
jgi:hypothetical protein